jgi:hypothetical protein
MCPLKGAPARSHVLSGGASSDEEAFTARLFVLYGQEMSQCNIVDVDVRLSLHRAAREVSNALMG